MPEQRQQTVLVLDDDPAILRLLTRQFARAGYRVIAADTMDEAFEEFEQSDLTLLETLDHVLNRGLVIAGEITISVADIDLIFVGLNVVLGSVETIREALGQRAWIGRPAPDAAPMRREPAQPAREAE